MKSDVVDLMLPLSEFKVGSRNITCVPLLLVLLLGAASVTEGGESQRGLLETKQARMEERRQESEDLRQLLQSDAEPEEKRKALDAFRMKREALQTERLSRIPPQTAEEKAAARQRMKESIRRLPEDRRKVAEERLAIVEEMEKLRSEKTRMNRAERQSRMQALMDRRRKMMETHMVAMKAEAAASESKARPQAPISPFHKSIKAEKEKLDAGLAASDPDVRRAAIERFREAVARAREARQQEMEQRLAGVAPPPSKRPQTSSQ